MQTYGAFVVVAIVKLHVNRCGGNSEHTARKVGIESRANGSVGGGGLTGPRRGMLHLDPCRLLRGFSSAQ